MNITIDGNDGCGKTTVIKILSVIYPATTFLDRGLPSKMTLDDGLKDDGSFNIILECPVEECQKRLARRNADLNEYYHTYEGLSYFEKQFRKLQHRIKNVFYVDSSQSVMTTVQRITEIIDSNLNVYSI